MSLFINKVINRCVLIVITMLILSAHASYSPLSIKANGTVQYSVLPGSKKIYTYSFIVSNTNAVSSVRLVSLTLRQNQLMATKLFSTTCQMGRELGVGQHCKITYTSMVPPGKPNQMQKFTDQFVIADGFGFITASPSFGVTVMPIKQQYAYITSFVNPVTYVCSIAPDGLFKKCLATRDFPPGKSHQKYLDGGYIALNAAGTRAYVTNYSNSGNINFCPIKANGTFGTCQKTGGDIPYPFGIVLNAAGTRAYVTNDGLPDSISLCSINVNGTFGACQQTGSGFSFSLGIALNRAGTHAYVANGIANDNTVSFCSINADGTFGACQETGSGFVTPMGITLNRAGTRAYVTNEHSDTVSLCPIETNGTFGSCKVAGSGFSYPSGIALNSNGTRAYVVNIGTNTVSSCPINTDGTFGTCQKAYNAFPATNGVQGIALTG